MFIAKLMKPRRLNKYGRVWEKGIEVVVDEATARILTDDERFRIAPVKDTVHVTEVVSIVKQETEEDEKPAGPVKPTDKNELYEAIRAAADQLDPDDEKSFMANGRPNVYALSKILGYDISAKERDAALEEAAPQGNFTPEAPAPKKGLVIRKGGSASVNAKLESEEEETDDLEAGEESSSSDPRNEDDDPSGVEV